MLTPNVKVVSVLPGWWRIVALFGAGVGLMVVSKYWSWQALVLLAPWLLVLITGVLVSLSFSEQRLGRSCFEAVAVGTGLTVGHLAWWLWHTAGAVGRFIPVGTVAASRTEAFAMTVLNNILPCLVIRLVGLWFVLSFIHRLVVQTGSLCWTCAYDLTGNESGVCPECGTKIGS